MGVVWVGGGRRDLPPWTKVLISLERLRVIFWKLGNVNKTFSKVSVHDQIVISQYFSEITDQISNKRNNPFLLFKFLTWYKVITYTGNVSCPVSLYVTSSIWSDDFISKRCLIRALHITHVIKVLMSSIVSFYQGLPLVQVSSPFHMWKLEVGVSWGV